MCASARVEYRTRRIANAAFATRNAAKKARDGSGNASCLRTRVPGWTACDLMTAAFLLIRQHSRTVPAENKACVQWSGTVPSAGVPGLRICSSIQDFELV